MELIVFDLDGTLLDRGGAISDYTRDTLAALAERDVAYTVATGRTLHASREILAPHRFRLPQVFKNGVMIWHPDTDAYSHQNFLTVGEISHVLEATLAQDMTPFIFTFEPGNRHRVYHPPIRHEVEKTLSELFARRNGVEVRPASQLPADAEISSISAIGAPAPVAAVAAMVADEPHLVAFSGHALEGEEWRWIDIHHADASKGGAIDALRGQLGVTRVVCFGDSDNDLSMFARADECYAPENASDPVREAATAVIGHHDEDGIARFLRQRFGLPA
ncbi:HAD family phosphatase [Marinihelvus fidelis]|uniref:HAD family phosphatase n=1 Tax=Marinihelvus fidelis TaxID=2613842 RepID=A0A5N0THF3_9GAMM|nr:HAD family hydrolase [Marinihelvus fidelis]KAA9132729.1 HAD family phosphatase [Marinihelvus fidelis]